ncbi:hypothetical protein FQN57_002314 [Myotisia sp. PD_48]|nr:hypothetical protein FQN57_002314 [Myotisia sp. PD_48]
MNPYDANPENIPESDLYSDIPSYGRYYPQADDFVPDPKHIRSTTPESLVYWQSVLELCDTKAQIYDNPDGGRDVFALGSIIVKSSHLKPILSGRRSTRDYSLADANEIKATELARSILPDLIIPEIYFSGKIDNRDILVQSRIPGVGLNVAWPYLSAEMKESFKQQTRDVIIILSSYPSPLSEPSYLVPVLDPVAQRGIQEKEKELLFGGPSTDDLTLMHNDLNQSNIIVDNDKIVAIIDWEMAGYFGFKRAADVHVVIRSPKREGYASCNLPEEFFWDLLYWNDLYDFETDKAKN